MNHLRYWTILALDWLDDKVLRHWFYEWVCCRVTLHPWREALCGGGCDRDEEGFCRRCGWREADRA